MTTRKLAVRGVAIVAMGLVAACQLARPSAPGGDLAGTSGAGTEPGPTRDTRPDAPQSWISGKVHFPGEDGPGGIGVAAYPEAAGPEDRGYRTTTGPDGEFFLEVPAGTYNVLARRAGSRQQAIAWRVQTATTVNLTLSPTGGIRGTVEAPGIADLTGADVYVPGTDLVAKTDASGSYTFFEVPVATYDLVAQYPGYKLGRVSAVAVQAGGSPTEVATISLVALAVPTPTPVPTSPVPPVIAPQIGHLAPDDTASASVTHDYQVKRGGVTSTFVWIPVFTAYQIINPEAAGCATCPVGYWVKEPPKFGKVNVDWGAETFGGFYAAKYEASRSDANPGDAVTSNGATAGSSSTLKVAQYCVPWTEVNWDQAVSASAIYYEPYSHLMRDDEWTALAVWAMTNGKTVYGNNGPEKDVDAADITFITDITFTPGAADRALTGSATSSLWAAGSNKTTHTGTIGGVFDLNGNVSEWTLNVGSAGH